MILNVWNLRDEAQFCRLEAENCERKAGTTRARIAGQCNDWHRQAMVWMGQAERLEDLAANAEALVLAVGFDPSAPKAVLAERRRRAQSIFERAGVAS